MLKKIDRYVSHRFITYLVGGLLLMALLYGSFDLLKKVEDLQETAMRERLALIGAYYSYVLPLFLLDVVPALVLMAAGLTLVQMAKAREILVLKASGTSLYRLVGPVFAWAFVLSIFVFFFQQVIAPSFARRKAMLERRIENDVERELLLRDPASGAVLFIGRYSFAEQGMRDVALLEFDTGLPRRLRRLINAGRGEWLGAGAILLSDVTVRDFDQEVNQVTETGHAQMSVKVGLDAVDFVRAAEEGLESGMRMQTLAEIHAQMRRNPNVADFKVVFHSRLASLFTPLTLLLVGIPSLIGFEQTIRSRLLGVIISILIAAGFYALSFIFSSMGATGTINPVIAGWLPTLMAGAFGLWLFQSMLT